MIARTDQELVGLLTTDKEFSHNIGTDFDPNNCAKANFVIDKLSQTVC